jgi:hypothetical protein
MATFYFSRTKSSTIEIENCFSSWRTLVKKLQNNNSDNKINYVHSQYELKDGITQSRMRFFHQRVATKLNS